MAPAHHLLTRQLGEHALVVVPQLAAVSCRKKRS